MRRRIAPRLELGLGRTGVDADILDAPWRAGVGKTLLESVVREPMLPGHEGGVFSREPREQRGRRKRLQSVLRAMTIDQPAETRAVSVAVTGGRAGLVQHRDERYREDCRRFHAARPKLRMVVIVRGNGAVDRSTTRV